MIDDAFEKMEYHPKITRDYYADNLSYDFSSAQIRNNKKKKKVIKLKYNAFVEGTVGFHRNKPTLGLSTGAGIVLNDKLSYFLTVNMLNQFSEEANRGRSVLLIGLKLQMSKFISIGFAERSRTRGDSIFEIENRFSLSIYPPKGGKISINYNNPFNEDIRSFGFEYGIPIGFGFDLNSIKKAAKKR